MAATQVYSWQRMPMLRLLIPLAAGICIQWYFPILTHWLIGISAVTIGFFLTYFFLPLKHKFRLSSFNGFAINLLLAILGSWLVIKADPKNADQWFAKAYKSGDY